MVTCTEAADMIEQMLDLDARAHILWHKASEQLRAGDVLGALDTIISVARELAAARSLSEAAAIAVYELATNALNLKKQENMPS